MPRIATKPNCNQDDLAILIDLANSRTTEFRMVQRADIILRAEAGESDTAVAESLGISNITVAKWRKRYINEGLEGLYDRPRSGKPPKYDPVGTKNAIISTLEKPPPLGQATWDGPALSVALNISTDKVYRILREQGICLKRRRSWCVSKDPNFTEKAADVVGLYINPPENSVILSMDEKPSIQAIERLTGYVRTDSGKIVHGYKSTYIRHGTVNLFAALDVSNGQVITSFTNHKKRVDFLEFMDKVVAEFPVGKEIHVIMDNYCIHKKCDSWLASNPNVKFHYTPTSASWMNMVEIWFGVMSRKALKNASFNNIMEVVKAIEDFLAVYSKTAKPYKWKKREVRGSQLRNTLANFCN